jgi:hypothetical protein
MVVSTSAAASTTTTTKNSLSRRKEKLLLLFFFYTNQRGKGLWSLSAFCNISIYSWSLTNRLCCVTMRETTAAAPLRLDSRELAQDNGLFDAKEIRCKR